MFDWSEKDFVFLPIGLFIMLFISILLNILLKNKTESKKQLPLKFVAIIVVALEIAFSLL